jgi:pantetheine-phosphate adenylyltransferase
MAIRRAVAPGSFDPITLGHLDVIERASKIFDEAGLFSIEERIDLITRSVSHLKNVRVDSWSGLLADYCEDHEIAAIVKGLRAVSDFDYELQMSQMNLKLKGIETFFMATKPDYSFLSSSLVKEISKYGGDVGSWVPSHVHLALQSRFGK